MGEGDISRATALKRVIISVGVAIAFRLALVRL